MDEPDWNEAHFALAQEHGVPDGWCKRCGPWWEYDVGEDDPPPDGPCDCLDRLVFSDAEEPAGATPSESADKEQGMPDIPPWLLEMSESADEGQGHVPSSLRDAILDV